MLFTATSAVSYARATTTAAALSTTTSRQQRIAGASFGGWRPARSARRPCVPTTTTPHRRPPPPSLLLLRASDASTGFSLEEPQEDKNPATTTTPDAPQSRPLDGEQTTDPAGTLHEMKAEQASLLREETVRYFHLHPEARAVYAYIIQQWCHLVSTFTILNVPLPPLYGHSHQMIYPWWRRGTLRRRPSRW